MHKLNSNLYTPIAIVIAGVIVAGAVLYLGHAGGTATTTTTAAQQPSTTSTVNSAQVSTTGDPIVGNPSAPLTIAYWFDYQCPFCRENEASTMPSILKDYVDTGKVKIVYKDFSFLGADSDTLGHYGRAVWAVAPNQFEAWHEAIFANQGEENTGWATAAVIKKITASVLTAAQTAQVIQLATSNATQYQNEMNADKQEGTTDGVQGTPAMLIGDQFVDGYEAYSQVKPLIDQALAALNK